MKKIDNKKNKTREELENEIKNVWNLPKPTEFELKNWKCKFNLSISVYFLIGKTIFNWSDRNQTTKSNSGVVENVIFDKIGMKIIDKNKKIWTMRDTAIKIFNPFSNKTEFTRLAKRKGCINIFESGFIISDKDFKKIYYQTDEYQNKIKETLLKKYNVFYTMDIPGVKEKTKKTMKERHGVEWFLKRGKHYDAIDNAMVKKYGVKHPIQSNDIKSKISNTMKERYGVDWFLQRGEHYSAIEDVMIKKYGSSNIFETMNILKNSKAEINFIKKITSEIKFKNPQSILSNSCKKITTKGFSYTVDFYDENYNIIIEFYGDFWHCNPKIYGPKFINPVTKKTAKEQWKNDLIRKQKILESTGSIFIEVWESDWNKNSELIIDLIKDSLKGK